MNVKAMWQELKVSMQPRISEWKFMLRRIKETPLSLAGVFIILFFVAISVLAPILAPPESSDPFVVPRDMQLSVLTANPTPPTTRHIFGTTDQQYDLYYACIWGTISAFRVGVMVVGLLLIIGLIVGTIAAYYGGLIDEALMRFTDIIIAFPGLVLAMALVIAFPAVMSLNLSMILAISLSLISFPLIMFYSNRRLLLLIAQILLIIVWFSLAFYPWIISLNLTNLDKVLIAITLVSWPGYARLIRGEVLRVKNEDFVEAARACGCSDFRIITKHILPNTIYPVLIAASMDIGSIVLTAAALSFLGLGAPPDYADWGQIISRCRPWISQPELLVANYHTFLIPGLFLVFFVMGWNLLGDALRDVLDPMMRRR
ncbi:MAG: ABC transporter permease [Candidatus Bathyarchaeia archaeon]|nr:ABC transporter permease [Candidatus Bathyarchaeia archaeon]